MAARGLALSLVALVSAVPATGLAHHTPPANAAEPGVMTGAASEPGPNVRVQPWATRGPEVAVAPQAAWIRPNAGPLTSNFGYRWGKLHEGIDLGGAYGSAIYAAGAGVVTFAGPENGYGVLITVSHGTVDGDAVVTAYGHMSSVLVHAGERVHPGQLIARVGSAGDATGPHLHFEVRLNGAPVEPRAWLQRHGVQI